MRVGAEQVYNSLNLEPSGTGTGQTGQLQFSELVANGTNFIGFKAPDSITNNVIWTLPTSDGTTGQVLTTNGLGVLSWATSSIGLGTVTSVAVSSTGSTLTITGSPITTSGTINADIVSNVVLPGTAGIVVPSGTTTQRPSSPANGQIRYNTTLGSAEIYGNGTWQSLSFSTGLIQEQITDLNGSLSEPMMFVKDTTRSNKVLSIEVNNFILTSNSVNTGDWILFSSNVQSDSGWIAPYPGTVVRATAYCSTTNNNSKYFSLYVNNTAYTQTLYIQTTPSPQIVVNATLNIDFNAGDKLRVQAAAGPSGGGNLANVVLTYFMKWRGS